MISLDLTFNFIISQENYGYIVFALRRYSVPEDWIDLIMAYYDGLWGKTTIFWGVIGLDEI